MRMVFIYIILVCLLFPSISTAGISLNLDYPRVGGLELNMNQDINEIVAWIYYFIIRVAGIVTFFMVVLGGVQWLTSAGDANKLTQAKEMITSAFIGLIIILGSFLILQILSPEFKMFNLPEL